MRRNSRFVVLALSLSMLSVTSPLSAEGQRQRDPKGAHAAVERDRDKEEQRKRERRPVVVRGHVFIGGYFYDPFFGPYPWWPQTAYPYWYFPIYDNSAELRVRATPKEAAVYVDGFYAGIVDDFDGVFQPLALPPGGHQIALYLAGYRTARHNVYLRPSSTMKLHHTMERLPAGVKSEPPPIAPAVPLPPPGSYRSPRTPPPTSIPLPPAPETTSSAVGFGTLDLRVQPMGADVIIDGERWVSSEEGSFVVQLPVGEHRVEAFREGYPRFSIDVDIREGETTPLNVSLLSSDRP